MVELHIILALTVASLICTVLRLYMRKHILRDFWGMEPPGMDTKGNFKVNFNALKHDVERECSLCRLKVSRYVPNGDGTKIACANCVSEGKVGSKTDLR